MLKPAPAFAVLLCALAGLLGTGASLHCAVRREISPCTCRRVDENGSIEVKCQEIGAYENISRALSGRFNPETKINLEISRSILPDLSKFSFNDLGLSITKLKLNLLQLSELNEGTFMKLDLVDFFSLDGNSLVEMPRNVLKHLPHVKSLDLRRNKISKLSEDDFRDILEVRSLFLGSNQITKIERHALPTTLRHLQLAINKLTTLNGALRDLDNLEWILLTTNHLKSIDNEMPLKPNKITLLHAAHNELQGLPKDMKLMSSLENLYIYNNKLKSLDGALQKNRKLETLDLSFNKIETLAADDFLETEGLQNLDIAYNQLKSLNGSLRTLKDLRYLNLTHNQFTSFSLQEIKGLRKLSVIDLSHNKITHLSGGTENLVDVQTRVLELRIDHNYLQTLGGALMGLHGLLTLNVSHNLLQKISPDDLIGFDELKTLDISHNQIITLEETSKTFLPELESLLAHHNNITHLDKDFHGLPSLCLADLSYNHIRTINYDLVTKTRCTIDGVQSLLKIYLEDNPVLCDDSLYELVSVMESLNARLNGRTTCVAPQTSAPVLMRALNDILPQQEGTPVIVMAQVGPGVRMRHLDADLRNSAASSFRRVGTIIGHMLPDREDGLPVLVEPPVTLPPATNNVVVKWPDEERRPAPVEKILGLRPLPDLRLRDLKPSP